jgi:glycosyltransferase involved in cell wall biosynthesis
MPKDSKKLNLGSGCMLRDDCLNFDAIEIVRGGKKTDVIGDIKDVLEIFGENRFEEILCSHVLEHFYPEDGEKMIRDCYKMLKKGGKLILEAPDIMGTIDLYKEGHPAVNRDMVEGTLFGHTKHKWGELGIHKSLYTRQKAKELVEKCEFKVIHAGIGLTHGMGKRDFRIEGIKEGDRTEMVSAIVPCCNEYPQVLFTVQSLLIEGCDEVLVISNKSTDKTNEYFTKLHNSKVRFFIKDDVLSHWQAKNAGIENAGYGLIFFCDSHCVLEKGSIEKLKDFVTKNDAAAHCLIKYMLDPRGLDYKFLSDTFSYRFSTARHNNKPYQVPIMSTCGMMLRKSAIDRFGGWNKELGIYGGGEQYMNFKHGVCDYPHYVIPEAAVWHYADKRGYQYNYDDFVRNQFVAAYCVGGDELLNEIMELRLEKDRPLVLRKLMEDVKNKCSADRAFIQKNQKLTYKEFVKKWSN